MNTETLTTEIQTTARATIEAGRVVHIADYAAAKVWYDERLKVLDRELESARAAADTKYGEVLESVNAYQIYGVIA